VSEPTASRPGSTRTGPGRLLVAIYGLFALSASARAGVQIATKFSHAPVAYLLSAFAGLVYILATVTLANGSQAARRIAVASCSVELVGVLAVGTWSLADRATFPDATVWSGYGSGYGYVPLVLPVFGLLWLRYWNGRRSQLADGAEVAPVPVVPDELARLRQDAALPLLDVDSAELHRAGGVEEPAVARVQDGEAGPPQCRVEGEGRWPA
jgi:hypothetical protein